MSALTTVLAASALASTVDAPASTAAPTTTTIDPGSLPQTSVEPSFGAPLTHQTNALWTDLRTNNVARARSLFFPRSAYLKMKTGLLPNPSADYAKRLIAFYDLDVAAYHRYLLTGGAATLVRVAFNRADAAWVAPGHCENLIGYWHLPGVRFVYRHAHKEFSAAVASLISWRGVWYVVHLGPNPRPSDVGTVDNPLSGPGTPGPAGGC